MRALNPGGGAKPKGQQDVECYDGCDRMSDRYADGAVVGGSLVGGKNSVVLAGRDGIVAQ